MKYAAGRQLLVKFIRLKIADARRTLKCREQMAKVWRSGTDAEWRAVGCRKSKAQRLDDARIHDRIAVKNRHELEMLRAVLAYLCK